MPCSWAGRPDTTRSCCRSRGDPQLSSPRFQESLLRAMVILLGLDWSGLIVVGALRTELLDRDCRESACGSDAPRDQHGSGYAYWTHGSDLSVSSMTDGI